MDLSKLPFELIAHLVTFIRDGNQDPPLYVHLSDDEHEDSNGDNDNAHMDAGVIHIQQITFGNFLAALAPQFGLSVCLQLYKEWQRARGRTLVVDGYSLEWGFHDQHALFPLLCELARRNLPHLFCRVVSILLSESFHFNEMRRCKEERIPHDLLLDIITIISTGFVNFESMKSVYSLLHRTSLISSLRPSRFHRDILIGILASQRFDFVQHFIRDFKFNGMDQDCILRHAVSSGSVKTLQLLKDNGFPMPVGLIFKIAMLQKHIEIARWIFLNGDRPVVWTCSQEIVSDYALDRNGVFEKSTELEPFDIETANMTIKFGYPYDTIKTAYRAAKDGDLEFLTWLLEQGGTFYAHMIAEAAAKSGHIHVLDWCERTFGIERMNSGISEMNGRDICLHAANRGHVCVLDWCYERFSVDQSIADDALFQAFMYNKRDTFHYLLQKGATWIDQHRITNRTVPNFVIIKSFGLIQHLWKQRILNEEEKLYIFTRVLCLGRLDLAEWALEPAQLFSWQIAEQIYHKLPACFRPDLVIWLQARLGIAPPIERLQVILENAMLSGRLDVLQHVTAALDSNIHSSPLKERYRAKCKQFFLDECCDNGSTCRSTIAKDKFNKGSPDDLYAIPSFNDLSSIAADMGRLDILQFVHSKGAPSGKFLCTVAAYQGRLDIIEWALRRGYEFDSLVCRAAAASGHYDILRWLIENGCAWDPTASIAILRDRNGSMLHWMKEKELPWHNKAVDILLKDDRVSSLEWLKSSRITCPLPSKIYDWPMSSAPDSVVNELTEWMIRNGINLVLGDSKLEEQYELQIEKMMSMNGNIPRSENNLKNSWKWMWNEDISSLLGLAIKDNKMQLAERIIKDAKAAGQEEHLRTIKLGESYDLDEKSCWRLQWAIDNCVQVKEDSLASARSLGALCVVRAALRAGYAASTMTRYEPGVPFVDSHNLIRLLALEGFKMEITRESRTLYHGIPGFPHSFTLDQEAVEKFQGRF